jgi:hypothetical protein
MAGKPGSLEASMLGPAEFVNWLSFCKNGFIPYLQNNWALDVSTILKY